MQNCFDFFFLLVLIYFVCSFGNQVDLKCQKFIEHPVMRYCGPEVGDVSVVALHHGKAQITG